MSGTIKEPKLWEFSGPVSDGGNFTIRIVCPELGARHLRQVLKVLEMTAGWLEDDGCAIPIPMILFCPSCGGQHVDEPKGDWTNPPHRSHLCASCGHIWRPCDRPTAGVLTIQTSGRHDHAPPVRSRAEMRQDETVSVPAVL
jgi:hypothetical protein